VKRILNCGVHVDIRDEYGRTALHDACYYGHREIVHVILDAGADTSFNDEFGHTPRIDAEAQGHVHVLELLDELAKTPRSTQHARICGVL